MDFAAILERMYEETRRVVLWATLRTQVDLADTVDALRFWLWRILWIFVIGQAMSCYGDQHDSKRWEDFGQLVTAIAAVSAQFLFLVTFVRVGTLGIAAYVANQLATAVVDAIPGTIRFPEVVNQHRLEAILRGVMAGFACLGLAGVYAIYFPVYTNFAGFLGVISSCMAIGGLVFGLRLPQRLPIAQWAVYILAFGAIGLTLGSYVLPYSTKYWLGITHEQRRLARVEEQIAEKVTQNEVSGMRRLERNRAQISNNLQFRDLTRQEIYEQAVIDRKIREMKSGATAGYKPDPGSNFSFASLLPNNFVGMLVSLLCLLMLFRFWKWVWPKIRGTHAAHGAHGHGGH